MKPRIMKWVKEAVESLPDEFTLPMVEDRMVGRGYGQTKMQIVHYLRQLAECIGHKYTLMLGGVWRCDSVWRKKKVSV